MGQLLFRTVTKIWFAVPLAILVVLGFAWWASASCRLARQIDRHEPTAMGFDEAVAAGKDGDVYVRLDTGKLDCSKGLAREFGKAFAILDRDGRVAAMARLPDCATGQAAGLQGVFREPPYLLYGDAVGQGWNVTPGRLAYFDTLADSSDAWKRVAISAVGAFFMVLYAGSIFIAHRASHARRSWRVRGLGFWFLALTPWLAYIAHDYVYVRVVPVPVVAAIAALIALAMVAVPDHWYIQKATRWWGLNDEA
jgi:hypothetical protein